MEGFEPAVIAPRKAGEPRIAVLRDTVFDEAGAVVKPAIAVQFVVPDFLILSTAEAASAAALAAIRESGKALESYGFTERQFTDAELPGLSRLVTAIETAAHLWRDWNAASRDPESGAVTVWPLDRAHIGRLLEDAQIRAAWNAHLEAASPLEREEGNAYAASPPGSTASAANTAPDASSADPVAPEAGAAEPENSAPA